MDTEIQAKIYLDNLVTKGKGPLKTGFAGKNTSSAEPEASVSGISSMQSFLTLLTLLKKRKG